MGIKQPVSEQTKKNLCNYTLLNLQVINEQLDFLRAQIRMLDEMAEERNKSQLQVSSEIKQLRRVCEYTMLIGMISNDLSVVYRVYLRAEDPYEVQYASKQIVVILTEGFKQVFHFISINDQGHLVTRNRDRSIWKKDMGKIVRERLPHLLDEYLDITGDLERFDDADLKAMQAPRNIFVHYDPKPCRAFDELLSVHIEEVTQKAIPFLEILKRMMEFNFKMTDGYLKVIVKSVQDAFVEHKAILSKMKSESEHSPEAVKIVQKGIDNLARMKEDYDKKNGLVGK